VNETAKKKEVEKMKRIQLCLSLLLPAGVMAYTPIAIAVAASDPAPHQPKGVKLGLIWSSRPK
jgi:hypothetical protein